MKCEVYGRCSVMVTSMIFINHMNGPVYLHLYTYFQSLHLPRTCPSEIGNVELHLLFLDKLLLNLQEPFQKFPTL